MAPLLGKRKRRDQIGERSSSSSDENGLHNAQYQALMQKHFESQFKPLAGVAVLQKEHQLGASVPHPTTESGTETDWEGVSDSDDDEVVEVISHENLYNGKKGEEGTAKMELKKFMTSKPPSSTSSAPPQKLVPRPSSPTSLTEASHLKNDIALQYLLSSSSLFSDRPKPTLHDLTPNPLHLLPKAKQKMPLAHRKGIEAKARTKEDTRRREARDNGIVLEKKTVKRRERERDSGVGGPTVGKMKGGTLRLSKKDVREIEGPSGGDRGRGSFGRGRRKGRGSGGR